MNLPEKSGSFLKGLFSLINMNYNQAFPIIYRKLKESGVTMNSLSLIQRLKSFEVKVGDIQDQHIEAIVKKIVNKK